MSDLVFADGAYQRLLDRLLVGTAERAAVLFTRNVGSLADPRLLVVSAEHPAEDDYVSRDTLSAVLSPAFVLRVVRRAQREELGLAFAHSHPFATRAEFSTVDDDGEVQLTALMGRMYPAPVHAAIVLARDGCSARELGTKRSLRVIELGRTRRVRSFRGSSDPTSADHGRLTDTDDRQVRALGSAGAAVLRTLRVAVVGAGGTGSLVAQQLAHLGVQALSIYDPDTVEATNINRVAGATWADVGLPKAVVVARALERVRTDVLVRPYQETVHEMLPALAVAHHDFVFCCTDTHGSRAVLGQLAYQYFVPTIDMGVVIRARDGIVSHVAGRVHYLAPGIGCLVCAALLNPAQVRLDLLNDVDRAGDPYFEGPGEPQPAVIAYNGVVASTAVAMFLSVVTGVGTQARMVNYDGLRGTVRPAEPHRDAFCIVCSEEGALGRGHTWALPARPA